MGASHTSPSCHIVHALVTVVLRSEGVSDVAEASARGPFLTVAEVAEMMRVSNMTVYRLINAGAMKAVRIGKSYRLPEAEVDRYLREGAAAEATG